MAKQSAPRPIVIDDTDGKAYTFVSDHPKEERIVCLDDLPRDAFGSIVLPNEPWDGVETCPGIALAAPRPRRTRPDRVH
jgi:hypothetical protein